MKALKFMLFAFAMATLVMFSCQKDNTIPENGLVFDEAEDPLFKLTDLNEMAAPDVTEATEAEEFKMKNGEKHKPDLPCMHPAPPKKGDCRKSDKQNQKPDPNELGFILKQMKLDSTQLHAIKGFLKQHCDCISEHHKKVHAFHEELLKKANNQRKELLDAYKNGRINKQQFKEKLKAIHDRVKQQMQNDEMKKMHMRAMQKCREQLHKNIESVLNHQQLEQWRRWLQQHK